MTYLFRCRFQQCVVALSLLIGCGGSNADPDGESGAGSGGTVSTGGTAGSAMTSGDAGTAGSVGTGGSAGTGGVEAPEATQEIVNYSDFRRFDYRIGGALGFCPNSELIFEAHIEQDENRILTYAYTFFVPGNPEEDDCSPHFRRECYVATEQPPRMLDFVESNVVRAEFSEIVLRNDNSLCHVDLCVVPDFQWDDHRHSGYPCGDGWLSLSSSTRVIGMLELLRQDREP